MLAERFDNKLDRHQYPAILQILTTICPDDGTNETESTTECHLPMHEKLFSCSSNLQSQVLRVCVY